MVELQDLTVGQVSGMIAAAVFLVQVSIPIALPVILLGLLRPRSSSVTETAVSWSVIGRYLHSSLWPVILGTDSASTLSANKSTFFMSAFRIFMLVLIAVAAIVTPLGLYEGLVGQTESSSQAFYYIKDPSTFGLGTPPRTAASGTWSRICGYAAPYVCPNSPNKIVEFENATGSYIHSDYYDSKVPQKVIDVLESGLIHFNSSVSSAFDIQYRSYVQSVIDDDGLGIPIDNGTIPYTKGTYQPLSTEVLSDSYLAVEGLIVDMKNGGIGFRKHSAPPPRTYGSSWFEDLLFTSPETVCVDTNLTLDFIIPATRKETSAAGSSFSTQAFRLNLTDRGGYVNINRTYPEWERGDTQSNPELWLRAYKAAWLNNALSMAFMNVTNLHNETTSLKAFSYLNSTMNKTFPLHYPDGEFANRLLNIRPSSLQFGTSFGGYLENTDVGKSNVSTVGNSTTQLNFASKLPIYANPFNISITIGVNRFYNNFSSAELVCAGSGGGDLANITNMIGKCGLLYGTPRRQDGSASLLFDPGSAWTLPMYSCMSVVKASIKTVSLRFNNTNDLSGLTVLSIEDKTYPSEESKPLWAVENSDMPLKHGSPLWGMVTPEAAATLNLSTVRKESLYLPGFTGAVAGMSSHENLPAADFAAQALGTAYETGLSTLSGTFDYSGQGNLALYRLWQEYSRTAPTSAKILNLIWTDLAANLVLGTRGLQPEASTKRKRDEGSNSGVRTPVVTSYTRRVKYKYVYGIPAFLALTLTLASAVATVYFTLFGHAKPSTMRIFLQRTSAGRLLSSRNAHNGNETHNSWEGYAIPEQEFADRSESTKVWIKGAGREEFTLSAEGWTRNVQPHGPGYDKTGTTASYAPVPNVHAY